MDVFLLIVMADRIKAKNKDTKKRIRMTLWEDANTSEYPAIFSIDVSILQDQNNPICFWCESHDEPKDKELKKPPDYYDYWFTLPIGSNVKYFHLQCYKTVRINFGQMHPHHFVPSNTKQLKGFKSITSPDIKDYVRMLLWPMQVPYKHRFQQKLSKNIIHMNKEELRIELEKRNLSQFVAKPDKIGIIKKYKQRINKFLNLPQCKNKGDHLIHGYCRAIETDYPKLIIPCYLKCFIRQRFDW